MNKIDAGRMSHPHMNPFLVGHSSVRGSVDLHSDMPAPAAKVASATADPHAAKNRFDGAEATESKHSKNTFSGRVVAFFHRSPVLRLCAGGVIMAAGLAVGVVGSAASIAGGLGAFIALSPIFTTGILAAVPLTVGMAIAQVGLTVSVTVGAVVVAPGFMIAGRAVQDIKKWHSFKKLLTQSKASNKDIAKARQQFYSTSSEPIKILIRNDKVLTSEQKNSLENIHDRDFLWEQYCAVRQHSKVFNASSVKSMVPDRLLLNVSGTVPWNQWRH